MPRAMGRWLLAAAGLALPLTLLGSGELAEAHGKEADIAVNCVVPDPGRPLTRVCTATIRYPDGDPVTNADLELTAVREGNAPLSLEPVKFTPGEQNGLYSATVTFPAYGRWQMTFAVRQPSEGEAKLTQEISPPVPGTSPEIRARLQVVFAFGLADVRNIALRIAHLVGAISWFALSALVLMLSWLPDRQQRQRLLRRLSDIFPWATGASLLVLSVSGALSARYNAPTRSPGLFAPEVFSRLPFGEAYLTTFLVKMAIVLAILATTIGLAISLRQAYRSKLPIVAGAALESSPTRGARSRWVMRLAVANLILGLAVFANVVVMGYLHIISHVGAAAGAG